MTFGAKAYHDTVSYDRNAMSPHRLDWAHPPSQVKSYPDLTRVPLPGVTLPPRPAASRVLLGVGDPSLVRPPADLEALTQVLLLACAPTAVMRHAAGEHVFRSVPSAGALYPTELYLATAGVQDLEDGVYHYGPLESRLHRLRPKNPFPDSAPGVEFFLSAVFFRSAWKYRARSYRYHLLDTGHALEALILGLAAVQCPGAVHLDFDDDGVNCLLGFDQEREASLARVCSVHPDHVPRPVPRAPSLPGSVLRASRVSDLEVVYDEVRRIHENGKVLPSPKSEAASLSMVQVLSPGPVDWKPMPAPGPWPSDPSYADVVAERRSSRNFTGETLSAGDFFTLVNGLVAARRGRDPSGGEDPFSGVALGLLTGRVAGTTAGFHLVDPDGRRMGLVREGDLIPPMARICLDQAWLAGAAVHVLLLADLEALDRAEGPRGYRHAMLAAGRLGHRVYLTATALGLGCCGIGAFYDKEAHELLGLGDASRLLYLVAAGPVRRGLGQRNGRGH